MATERLLYATDPSDAGLPDEDGPVRQNGAVHVIHGIYTHSFPLVGMTVAQARSALSERLNVAPDAMAVVDGNPATEDTVLVHGQTLNFVKHAGEKGS